MRDTLINNAEKDVWIVFDILRATLEQRQVKNVLMPMITLKYLSENDDHGFNIPEASRWDRVTAIGVDFGERLRAAFQHLEYENPKLVNVFTDTFIMPRDEMSLFKVADSVLNRLSFKRSLLHNPDPLFGTLSVYIEEVWNQILSREGALGSSEILSPKSITTLLSQLIDKKQGLIYDGTSGLNNFLIESYRYAVEHGGQVKLYGQEKNPSTWAFGIINLILHGLYPSKVDVRLGGTITDPAWIESSGQLMQFDGVLMDPPFNLSPWGYEFANNDVYGRFRIGIPPKSSGDMAFILHALASLKSDGKAAIVVSQGVLVRGAEERIREQLLNMDVVEAVIMLPPNLFIGTGIPVAVLMLNKQKPANLKDKVLFVNATEKFTKLTRSQNELSSLDIAVILSAYQDQKEVDQYSRIVSIDEISENEWSLQPLRYFEKAEVNSRVGKVLVNREQYVNVDTQLVMLKDIAEISRGFVSKEEVEPDDASHYLVNLSDVQDGKIQLSGLKGVRLDGKQAAAYQLETGDVLLSSRGTLLKLAVVSQDNLSDKPLAFSQNFIRIRSSKVEPYFIKAFLESPIGQYYLEANQKGTTATVLSHKDVGSIQMPYPSLERQQEIAEIVMKSETAYEEAVREAKKSQEQNLLKSYELMGITESFQIID